jgi:hypothetical protein
VTIFDKAGCVAILALALAAGVARAEDSIFDSLAKSTGLMATPPDPPDFVKATRPKEPPTSIPVFAAPDEPTSKVKSAKELKAMNDDLERASRSQDGLRPKPTGNRTSGKARADHPAKN